MIRTSLFAIGMLSATASAQEVAFDVLYSWDSDDARVLAQSLTAWRHAPLATDTQLMDWYTSTDIDVRNSGHGRLRLGFQSEAPAAAAAMLPRIDFRNASVRLAVRAASWDDVGQLTVVFGSDGTSASRTATLDVKHVLKAPRNGEWIELVVPVADLERYNEVDLARINFAMVRAQGKPGSHVDVSTVSLVWPAADNPAAVGREIRVLDPQFDVGGNALRNAGERRLLLNYGARITGLDVRNDGGASSRATDARLLASADFGAVSFAGSLGVLDAHSQTTVGSAELVWRTAAPLTLSLGHARNAIDTVAALEADVVQDATTLAGDYSTPRWGFFAGVADIDYSDGNERAMWNAKLRVSVWERIGAHAYVRTLHYTNSDPYSGYYYSPDEYDRWLAGFSARARVSSRVIMSGHLDGGRQEADGEDSASWTTRVNLDAKPAARWMLRLSAGVDQTRPDYRYRYVMGYIAYQ